jgi:hypothetical protein
LTALKRKMSENSIKVVLYARMEAVLEANAEKMFRQQNSGRRHNIMTGEEGHLHSSVVLRSVEW